MRTSYTPDSKVKCTPEFQSTRFNLGQAFMQIREIGDMLADPRETGLLAIAQQSAEGALQSSSNAARRASARAVSVIQAIALIISL